MYSADNHFFGGNIDEVRLYDRALTDEEIWSLYQFGKPDFVNSASSQPQGGNRLDSGLASYWKFDEGPGGSATDASVNGNTGTLTNGPTWTTGRIGGAVSFDGTNQHVVVPHHTSFNQTAAVTVSLWVRFDSLPAGDNIVFEKGFGTGVNYGIDQVGDEIGLYFYNGGWREHITTNADLVTGNWYHVVATYDDAANNVRVFVNGRLALDEAESNTLITNNHDLFIGSNGVLSESINGSIDEVRVYNRALPADEVADLYRLTSPTGTDPSLKGYWSFNGPDISGTTALDRSGAGNNGTLVNGPTRVRGKIGQGLSFDGTDDYIDAGNPASLRITGSMTISVWIKATSFPGLDDNYILTKNDSDPDSGYKLAISSDNGPEQAYIHVTPNGSTHVVRYTNTTIVPNTWYHIAGTYDASAQTLHIYTNGVLDDGVLSGTVPAAQHDSPVQVVIGASFPHSIDNFFSGSLDEVRVYNRAITPAEIQGLYQMGK